MLRKAGNTLVIPALSAVFFIWLTVQTRNVVCGVLALVFVSASVSYAYEILVKGGSGGASEPVRHYHYPENRRKGSEPMRIPRSYGTYRSRDPVQRFFYEVSGAEGSRIVYFREAKDGFRVFWAQARKTGRTSMLLPVRAEDPDQLVEDIFAGKYSVRDYEACDRLLSEAETGCIQHLFDYEAKEYQAKIGEKHVSAYLYRKGSRRPLSAGPYAYFMQYVLQETARRGMTAAGSDGKTDFLPEE
ncbi:MAG: hypothetical protein LIO92_01225 [Clostridiales bacterium]|nr:hypothetical protein [Clostridiales bacterium]